MLAARLWRPADIRGSTSATGSMAGIDRVTSRAGSALIRTRSAWLGDDRRSGPRCSLRPSPRAEFVELGIQRVSSTCPSRLAIQAASTRHVAVQYAGRPIGLSGASFLGGVLDSPIDRRRMARLPEEIDRGARAGGLITGLASMPGRLRIRRRAPRA